MPDDRKFFENAFPRHISDEQIAKDLAGTIALLVKRDKTAAAELLVGFLRDEPTVGDWLEVFTQATSLSAVVIETLGKSAGIHPEEYVDTFTKMLAMGELGFNDDNPE